ncbi:PepSY domain-containing protein [Hydrogenimonas cancrithermarum]|uniref:PepSY domain-containing protein n=1 Tax=Hydrogenimonas cancrithermarum TaxID=2993563 RepID=A0ABM8FKV2_9BACT|nr:PepSY domain-containing protein [Hydrogenimonas cancrithermarum]BDY12300.1 hypothetical protein HCR_06120 [Hydrogenimonas cancrithermarum]
MKTKLSMVVILATLGANGAFCDELHGSIKIPFFKSEKSVIKKVRISMIQAIKTAKTKAPGQVIKAKLDEEDDYLVYKIEILTPDGREKKLLIDPITGKILEMEEED